MRGRLVAAAGGALVALHAWLLAGQAWNGELLEPGRAARWGLALLLVAALAAVRRRSGSLAGRRAIALWLLAALLHGPAAWRDDHAARLSPVLAEAVAAVVQAAATLGLALGLALLAWRRRRATGQRARPGRRGRPHRARLTPSDPRPALAPRPPPVPAPACS